MWRSSRRLLLRGVRFCSTTKGKGQAGAGATSSSSGSKSSWNVYGRLLEQHPIKAKMLSSGIIMGSGDFACQWLTRKQAEREAAERGEKGEKGEKGGYDLRRTAKFAFMGSLIIGPTLHHWYSFLARTFPGSTTAAAVKRLIVDQSVFAPTFIPIFFTGLQFLDLNFDVADIKAKLEADYLDTLVANWQLWIPAMFINFKFLPTKYQVLFSNGVGFLWNVYLSFQSFKPPANARAATK